MKDSEVLILRCPPPFYPQLASRSLLSVALLGCLPSLDAAVCVMRLHGLFFGTFRYSQLFTNRLAAFPVERDAVGDKVFSAFIPELFVISPRLNLFESPLAGLVEPGEGRRVLHLDNNVYTIRLTGSSRP